MTPPGFDCIFHLAGEQSLPIYIGMRQCACNRHVIVVSDKTRPIGEIIQQVARQGGFTVDLSVIPAYDTPQAIKCFQTLIADNPGCALNLTGGTKPMFAAGYQAGFAANIPMFYIETTGKTLDWIGSQPSKQPLTRAVDSVQTFIELAGFHFNKNRVSPVSIDSGLLDLCWENRDALGRWYRRVSEYNKYLGVPFKIGPDMIDKKVVLFAQQEGPSNKYRGTFQIDGSKHSMENWLDLASFVSGGWFELFVHRLLDGLKKDKTVLNSEINTLVEIQENPDSGKSYSLQELDIAFTDGYYLTILECKAGAVTQEHIQKLENLARNLGGHFGRGILISAFDLDDPVKRRIASSQMVSAICGEAIVRDPSMLLTIKSGAVVGKFQSNRPGKTSHR